VKLNTDGTVSSQQHTTRIGGAFHDLRADHNRLPDCVAKAAFNDINRLSMFEDLLTHARSVFEDDVHRALEVISLH
ncbi:hypothetical protein Goarm_017002, partial [Gossypium armourianum]|nr:hypothetical protein [Gossypium armourianum]